ncbi:HAD-IC family P-type ATPase [Humibacillus xanthopallidus]|uniref:cation-translocating P-type ATPase n=1 Tax=Humibacillus xanthopallidus TaxID=412689 RepID=UPI00384A7FD0
MERAAPAGPAVVAAGGLSASEVVQRLERDGPNVMPTPRAPSALVQLGLQLVHFFAIVLWVAAGLALVAGMPQLTVAIAVVVVLNGVFAFAQEHRAERAGARLADLLPPRARVVRDGAVVEVSATDLVVDDVVLLEAGDRISADLRLDRAVSVAVDESMLTGESVTSRPELGAVLRAGTFVVEGVGRGTVTATGGRTRLAEIAALTRAARRPPSPLSVQLHRIVTVVAVLAVATGVVAFGVSLLLGVEPAFGFLFAVGVTVALVPEGLLPTVTLSLARATQLMAGRHALVRRLEAVETLGSTTFICTDKTGTLTRNEMNVVEVWTPAGTVRVAGRGYEPTGQRTGGAAAVVAATELARSAVECVHGRAVLAELTPFVVWSLTLGHVPLALSVLQILALDIGTDLLPALALGAEPASERVMAGPLHQGALVDGVLMRRAFLVLGPAEAVVEMGVFIAVLVHGGWVYGTVPGAELLALASGGAFATVVLGQLANAFACRSASRRVGAWSLRGNRLLLWAVGVELAFLVVILGWPALAAVLGGSMPDLAGWAMALLVVPAVLAADAAHKAARRWGRRRAQPA